MLGSWLRPVAVLTQKVNIISVTSSSSLNKVGHQQCKKIYMNIHRIHRTIQSQIMFDLSDVITGLKMNNVTFDISSTLQAAPRHHIKTQKRIDPSDRLWLMNVPP